MHCTRCPRQCPSMPGYCGADSRVPEVVAVYAHTGEEPPLCGDKGISNIFFAHCNLKCCYCQNHFFSIKPQQCDIHGVDEIINATAESLKGTENIIGLVTPTHYSDIIPQLVEGLHDKGLFPTVVYNCGGYERVDTLRQLAPYIDIYLPDFKYADSDIAARYSHAPDYPEVAKKALKEMYGQKGSSLPTDEQGIAFRGMIVRHLVLPGQVQNSIDCLQWLAENLSTNIHVSLMSQYFPPEGLTLPDQLNRQLRRDEYDQVVDAFYQLGFHNGWVQELESADCYRPHMEQELSFT